MTILKKSLTLLAMLTLLVCMPVTAHAATEGTVKVAIAELESDPWAVGDTIKIIITAQANENMDNARVTLNLNNTSSSGPCYLTLVPYDSAVAKSGVYVDNQIASSTTSLDNSINKYYVNGSNLLSVTLGHLTAGETKIVTFYAKIAEGTINLNLVSVGLYKNNTNDFVVSWSSTSTPVTHMVREAGTKTSVNMTSTDGKTYPGDEVKYSITAYNNSASANNSSWWEDVKIIDTLPDKVTFVAGSLTIDGSAATEGMGAGQYTYVGSTLTVYLSNLGKGSSSTVNFKVTVNGDAGGKTITNMATISGNDYGRMGTNIVSVGVSDSFTVEASTYNAGYTFESSTVGKALPQSIWDLLPSDNTDYADGTTVYAINPVQLTVAAGNGTWQFLGWDNNNKTIAGGDVTFAGSWVFQSGFAPSSYNAGYTFTSATAGKALPQSVWDLLPSDNTDYADGTTVSAIEPNQLTVTTGNGSWQFQGWDANSKTIAGGDITFAGSWVFQTGFVPLVCMVDYDANGGQGSYSDNSITPGSSYVILGTEATGITRDGHSLKGWNTMADGSGTAYAIGDAITVSEDMVLYAQWNKILIDETNTSDTSDAVGTSGNSGKASIAKAGDSSNIGLWIALLLISLVGIVVLIVALRGRKYRKNKSINR